MPDFIETIAKVKPSERQYNWQRLEFYSFLHFGMNTFTSSEWGNGTEDPKIFDPVMFDAKQWVAAHEAAGMKGMILTCKHHDGFCLWPSAYTEHSVKSSKWKNGTGDIVRELSDACHASGLKFGIYLSPWDRHEKTYGLGDAYNDFFVNQLTELLTNYGDIFCVWFDGACGEGLNGKKQIYDWQRYYALIRELQPNAVINVCGPDVRWCGNEAGHCRQSEWSVVPARLRSAELVQEHSQTSDDESFRERTITSTDEDLGSREKLIGEELCWYPAETNTSIRPGWFYHAEEDDKVKSLDSLIDLYFKSVGGNSSLLLNIPPDCRGLIHENDFKRLTELGNAIKYIYATDLTEHISVCVASASDGINTEKNTLNDDDSLFYKAPDSIEGVWLEYVFNQPQTIGTVMLMEHILSGQRVEAFDIQVFTDGKWRTVYEGTVIGYKRLVRLEPVVAERVRINITQSRFCPTLQRVAFYK